MSVNRNVLGKKNTCLYFMKCIRLSWLFTKMAIEPMSIHSISNIYITTYSAIKQNFEFFPNHLQQKKRRRICAVKDRFSNIYAGALAQAIKRWAGKGWGFTIVVNGAQLTVINRQESCSSCLGYRRCRRRRRRRSRPFSPKYPEGSVLRTQCCIHPTTYYIVSCRSSPLWRE